MSKTEDGREQSFKKSYHGVVLSRGGSLAMILGTDVRLESPNPTPFIYQAK